MMRMFEFIVGVIFRAFVVTRGQKGTAQGNLQFTCKALLPGTKIVLPKVGCKQLCYEEVAVGQFEPGRIDLLR